MIYTLTLNPSLDYYININNLKKNGLNLANSNSILVGGKGINVSKVLTNLANDVMNFGYVGGFSGDKITTELNKLHINHAFIQINQDSRINLKIKDAQDNSETEIAGVSPIITKEEEQNLVDAISNTLKPNDILVCSGSIPTSMSQNIYKIIAQSLDSIKVVLDTRGSIIKDNLHKNFLIKPNILELEDMLQQKITTVTEVIKSCKYFLDQGIENIIVSMGKEGSLYVNSNEVYQASAIELELINTVGAGDSMVGGFISAISNGASNYDSYKMAIAAACATITSEGVATKSKVDYYLPKVVVSTV